MSRAAAPLALFACLVLGCEGREARQIAEAVETFVDFGMSNEERPKAPPRKRAGDRPQLHERSREAISKGRGEPTLEVVVDMSHDLSSAAVRSALEAKLELLLEEPYPRFRLIGKPAGLLRYGGVMGLGSAKLHKGSYATEVCALVDDDAPTLNDEQYKALVDLELALAGAPSARERASTLAKVRERRGAEVVDSALKIVKRRYSSRSSCPRTGPRR